MAFVVVTCVFFLFQLSFISNIRLRSDQNYQNLPADTLDIGHAKPKKVVETNHLNNNLKNDPKNSANTKKMSKLMLPLDNDGRPFLNYSLPFFYASMLYSHFGFKIVFVDDPGAQAATIQKGQSSNDFVGIETENKILDKNSLRTYDMVNDKPSSLRGINQHKAHLYQPDAGGQFNCLNSNVRPRCKTSADS